MIEVKKYWANIGLIIKIEFQINRRSYLKSVNSLLNIIACTFLVPSSRILKKIIGTTKRFSPIGWIIQCVPVTLSFSAQNFEGDCYLTCVFLWARK